MSQTIYVYIFCEKNYSKSEKQLVQLKKVLTKNIFHLTNFVLVSMKFLTDL